MCCAEDCFTVARNDVVRVLPTPSVYDRRVYYALKSVFWDTTLVKLLTFAFFVGSVLLNFFMFLL